MHMAIYRQYSGGTVYVYSSFKDCALIIATENHFFCLANCMALLTFSGQAVMSYY